MSNGTISSDKTRTMRCTKRRMTKSVELVEWAEEPKAAARITLTANRTFSPFCFVTRTVFFVV